MSVIFVISENCCNFIEVKYKELQIIIAIIIEDNVIEIFYMADDFRKFFDAMMEKYTLNPIKSENVTILLPCQRQKL